MRSQIARVANAAALVVALLAVQHDWRLVAAVVAVDVAAFACGREGVGR